VHTLEQRLAEALEQQTATAEILRVISSTHTDLQPVFDTIVRNAGRVCDAVDAVIFLVDGADTVRAAHWGPIAGLPPGNRLPLTRGTVIGRAILDAGAVHVDDITIAPGFPQGQELAARYGYRTTLAVPLLRESRAIGGLLIRRAEVRPFSEKQIALLQTFADQAVIAIENARLLSELQASNRDLTSALDTQTATSDILRVISRSQTDVQPVFDAIVHSAVRLLGAYAGHADPAHGRSDRARRVHEHRRGWRRGREGDIPTVASIRGTARPGHSRPRAAQSRRLPDRSPSARSLARHGPCSWLPQRSCGAAAPSRRGDRGDRGDPPRTRRVQ
jgi:GAF domain-containing protein